MLRGQDAQRGEIVFYLLEAVEYDLAIVGDIGGVACSGLVGDGAPAACVEDGLSGRSANRPERGRALDPGAGLCALKAAKA